MNTWLAIGFIAVVLVFAGIAIVNAIDSSGIEKTQETQCSTCGNSCTSESNCGLATCGAVTGGSCGCRG